MSNEERLTAAGWKRLHQPCDLTMYRWSRDGIDWYTEHDALVVVLTAERDAAIARAERAEADYAATDGTREGERRMLRVVFIGAACACVLYWQLGEKYDRKPHYDRELRDMYDFAAHAASETSIAALHALRDLGDEDASRVLGERGR